MQTNTKHSHATDEGHHGWNGRKYRKSDEKHVQVPKQRIKESKESEDGEENNGK